MNEDTLLTITQFIFALCLVTIFISDIKSMANGVAKLKNKIYKIKHKKEIDLKERNIKNLYSYIFYTILPELTKEQFVRICSNKFKYNDNIYELYFEKIIENDLQYKITLNKYNFLGINYTPGMGRSEILDARLILVFNFTRTGPECEYISLSKSYNNNLDIILAALILIYAHPKANNNSYYPEFKGDRNIYEQLD